MSNLLEKYGKAVKESSSKVEELDVIVNAIIHYGDDKKRQLLTNKGTFFPWVNAFKGYSANDLDNLSLPFNAKVTLVEKGEYVNIASIIVDMESLSTRSFVASKRITVQL